MNKFTPPSKEELERRGVKPPAPVAPKRAKTPKQPPKE